MPIARMRTGKCRQRSVRRFVFRSCAFWISSLRVVSCGDMRATWNGMRRAPRKSRIIVAAAMLALVPAWLFSAPVRGYLSAKIDIYRGQYTILGYGLPPASQPEFVHLLRQRYGIEYRAVAGC